MSISGNLKTMELAELLQWVAQSSKTGTLVIEHGAVTQRIFFHGGRVIATASSEPDRRLGHFLVSRRLVGEDEIAAALRDQQSSNALLGQILVSRGTVSEEEVRRLLMQKADEDLFEMFLWEEGEFGFVDEQSLRGDMVEISLDVTTVVLQAAERTDEWKRIIEIIPHKHCVPVTVGFVDDADLPPAAKAVADLIDDDRTVAEIIDLAHCSDFFVRKTLHVLLEQGKLKIVAARDAEVSRSVDLEDINADTHLEIAERRIAEAHYGQALRHLGAARSLDPNGLATTQRIENAEESIRTLLEQEGLQLQAVPRLNLAPSEIPTLRLSPEEGFVMSRIDGSYTLDSILKISPMPALDAQLVFRKLLKAGHITLAPGRD